MSMRRKNWSRLAQEWKLDELESLAIECTLEQLNPEIDRILAGGQRGRVVVKLQCFIISYIIEKD